MKARMGRPPLGDGQARQIVFTLRVTEAERDAIVEVARRVGQPATRWARSALMEAVRSEMTRETLANGHSLDKQSVPPRTAWRPKPCLEKSCRG